MTDGHLYLLDNLNTRPQLGWQIDPFGGSTTMAAFFAEMGFQAYVNDRIDYRVELSRAEHHDMEFVWRQPSPFFQANNELDLMTHTLDVLYMSPAGAIFEDTDVGKADKPLTPENIEARSLEVATQIKERAKLYTTNHVLIPFGGDFFFHNASAEFDNMDLMIEYINSKPWGMKLHYATLSEYFEALHAANKTYSVFKQDYLPYVWPAPDCVWTGFYTSRPALKGFTRRTEELIRSADTLYVNALARSWSADLLPMFAEAYDNIVTGRKAVAIMQHHDAVTGTAAEHTVAAYNVMLQNATTAGQQALVLLSQTLLNSTGQVPALTANFSEIADALPAGKTIAVVLHNSLAQSRDEYVRLLVPTQTVAVADANGTSIVSQLIPAAPDADGWFLYFRVSVPALGFSTYFLSSASSSDQLGAAVVSKSSPDVSIENEFYAISFSDKTNLMEAILLKNSSESLPFTQQYYEYMSDLGSAYIFRARGAASPIVGNLKSVVSVGPLVQEIQQVISPELRLRVRLFAGGEYIEFENYVGVLKEDTNLITRFSTGLASSGGQFFTDNNGLVMMERVYDRAVPVENSYYPAATNAYLGDASHVMNIITNQPHGVTSPFNGAMELMLHRRLPTRGFPPLGLPESLNDTTPVSDTFRMTLSALADGPRLRHAQSLTVNNPLQPVFGVSASASDWAKSFATTFSPLASELPANVHLLSLKARSAPDADEPSKVIFRLQHLYEMDEDAVFSQAATVNVSSVFAAYGFGVPQETVLTMNLPAANVSRWHWNTQQGASRFAAPPSQDATSIEASAREKARLAASQRFADTSDFSVTLHALQIRSFLVDVGASLR
eukprot:TRINITY_DN2767_c0_g1_i1.p1 TRINITY_DN2767_c0_g1~~TRINITY_DN2767_c0_g1_i1.p1  ORF type:complete len:839 (+),score=278.83 TRINITY_DN2767_c0_g1_i1:553-3069(+)